MDSTFKQIGFFTISDVYFEAIEKSKKLHDEHGFPPWPVHNYGLIAETVNRLDGVHIDIGTASGYSAIMAALFKPRGHVYTIDPNPQEELRRNLEITEVTDKVTCITAESDPWPFDGAVATVYIDGNHRGKWPMSDMFNAMKSGAFYIIFDDIHPKFPDVVDAFKRGSALKDYRPVHLSGRVGILQRV